MPTRLAGNIKLLLLIRLSLLANILCLNAVWTNCIQGHLPAFFSSFEAENETLCCVFFTWWYNRKHFASERRFIYSTTKHLWDSILFIPWPLSIDKTKTFNLFKKSSYIQQQCCLHRWYILLPGRWNMSFCDLFPATKIVLLFFFHLIK